MILAWMLEMPITLRIILVIFFSVGIICSCISLHIHLQALHRYKIKKKKAYYKQLKEHDKEWSKS